MASTTVRKELNNLKQQFRNLKTFVDSFDTQTTKRQQMMSDRIFAVERLAKDAKAVGVATKECKKQQTGNELMHAVLKLMCEKRVPFSTLPEELMDTLFRQSTLSHFGYQWCSNNKKGAKEDFFVVPLDQGDGVESSRLKKALKA